MRKISGRRGDIIGIAMAWVLTGCVTPGQPVRPELSRVVQGLPGISVALTPVGDVSWRVTVASKRPDQLLLHWDESSFIAGDGISRGRLLRGQTRLMDAGRIQPSTPVAPGATVIA